MTTIGDVFTIFGTLATLGFCGWACILFAAHLWPSMTQRASTSIPEFGFRRLANGLWIGVLFIVIDVVLFSAPLPLLKVLGFVLLGLQFGIGVIGASSLAKFVARRIDQSEPGLPPGKSLSAAAIYLVATALFPILGWLLFAPLLHAFCLGIGIKAILPGRKSDAQVVVSGA